MFTENLQIHSFVNGNEERQLIIDLIFELI
jgi:hypothetical protein